MVIVSLRRSFSIPNRIEPSATLDYALLVGRLYMSFSIPNRIEPSATLQVGLPHRGSMAFQYPQSDRALCNLVHG